MRFSNTTSRYKSDLRTKITDVKPTPMSNWNGYKSNALCLPLHTAWSSAWFTHKISERGRREINLSSRIIIFKSQQMPLGQKDLRCRQGERSWGQPMHRCKHQITIYNSKQVLIEEPSPVIRNSEQENKPVHSFNVCCYGLDFRLIQWAERD